MGNKERLQYILQRLKSEKILAFFVQKKKMGEFYMRVGDHNNNCT